MLSRPSLKKRRFVIESSEDDEDSSTLPPRKSSRKSSPLPWGSLPRAHLAALSSANPSYPSQHNSLPPPANVRRPLPTSLDITAVTAGTQLKSKPVVSKPTWPESSPKGASGKNRSVPTFFSSSQQAPSSSSSYPVTKPPTTSQHEDLDDLIEDAFSDDEIAPSNVISNISGRYTSSQSSQTMTWASSRGGMANSRLRGKSSTRSESKQSPQSVARKNGANSSSQSVVELRAQTRFNSSAASAVAKFRTVVTDPHPWPERFAPVSSADLAVHPKKVAEVRSWLEHVLDGFSKQRLLILKGPAGTGKTATINALSNELGFEVVEWKNPSSATRGDMYGEAGAFSAGLTGVFEEFIGRAGRFGSLEMVSTASPSTMAGNTIKCAHSDTGGTKKIILIEDFPNALFTSSPAPLASFRHTIKSFLAIPPPPRNVPPLPPLVLIVSESAAVTGPDAFTAHRLLSLEILHHPLVTSIIYNKIAPTFMLKALSAVMARESRESGRKSGPSKPLMEALAASGDVRSAIMGLEFLGVNGELGAFSEKVAPTGKRKKLGAGELNEFEREMLLGVTHRESQLGIFHAIGKVVYNKRYGDDLEDPYTPPPPKPLLEIHPWRNRASRVDINSLMDEAGTDAQTLVFGLHENYLGSCNFLGGFSCNTHSLEDLLHCVNNCIGDLSDSDILASPRPYHSTLGAGAGANYEVLEGSAGTAGIRQDEISFHAAVRGLMMALPSPVKRDTRDNKMFYPTNLKLWRKREEIQGLVDLLVGKFRRSEGEYMSGGGAFGTGRTDMVLERLPYLKIILGGQQQKASEKGFPGMKLFSTAGRARGDFMKDLERVTLLKGIGGPSESLPDDLSGAQGVLNELEAAEEQRKGLARVGAKARVKVKSDRKRKEVVEELEVLGVESLVLADDEIEDDF